MANETDDPISTEDEAPEDVEDAAEDLDDELDLDVEDDDGDSAGEEDDDDEDEDAAPSAAKAGDDDDDEDEDDVEADLDTILKERLASADDEDDDEDEEPAVVIVTTDDGEQASGKRSNEIVCTNCFLLIKESQLGPAGARTCPSGEDETDCAAIIHFGA